MPWTAILSYRRFLVSAALASVFAAQPVCLAERKEGPDPVAALQREISALEDEMSSIESQRSDLSKQLQGLATQEGIARRKLELARAESRDLSRRADEEEDNRIRIQASLEASREGARDALREIYKQGRMSGYRTLLTVADPADLLRAAQTLNAVARRQQDAVADFLDRRTASEETSRRLAARKAALDAAMRREQNAADAYADERRRREALLDRLADDKATHQRAVEELERAARELSEAIASLPPGSPPPQVTTDFERLKGSLPWPAPGPVVLGFGTIRNRRFGTVTPHSGLDIRIGPGGAVRAVAAGRVVFSRRYGAYGRTVVIDHGGRYLSVYAKLAAASVEEGQGVVPGQEVGFAPEGDRQGNSSIYFEIRYQGKAVDPERWLRHSPTSPLE